MARPVKRRRVCGLPPVGAFRPEGGPGGPVIEVTVDEYEAVRLIDLLAALPPPGRGRGPVRKRPPDLPGGGPLPGTVWSGTEQDETGGTEHENSSDI